MKNSKSHFQYFSDMLEIQKSNRQLKRQETSDPRTPFFEQHSGRRSENISWDKKSNFNPFCC